MGLGVLQTFIKMSNLVLCILKTAIKATIEQAYILNQDLTPMVGSLNSSNELKDLIDMSSHSFYIEKKSELVAFIVCLRENSIYKSQNYIHFDKKYERFLYIDRVGVKKKHDNKGIGTYLYEHILNINQGNR